MESEIGQVRKRLKTPRAAAIAGIAFSLLLIASLSIIRLSIPANLNDPGEWAANPAQAHRIILALNMVPFAGIAFLWFIGVVRDLIGEREDRFFSTVFLGSGLLYVAMLFAAAAVAGGILASISAESGIVRTSGIFAFGRAVTYSILNVFAMKMAGVFMISTSTIVLKTERIPRWLAIIGYVFAAILLITITYVKWIDMIFPLWVLMLSLYILIENYRHGNQA